MGGLDPERTRFASPNEQAVAFPLVAAVVFADESDWKSVGTNMRLLMSYNYPSEQYVRIWFATAAAWTSISQTLRNACSDIDVAVGVYDGDAAVDAPAASDGDIDGLAAYFDYPADLLRASAAARDAGYSSWDAYSPFPIHGIEDAMGIGRSWLPWVTFAAGATGFMTANLLQFGMLSFDWPMIVGGKPYAPWPSFVPIMFELTVLIGGVTTALVMLVASGCFRKPKIIDPEITNDRFVLWIASDDPDFGGARDFMAGLEPVDIKPVTFR